MLLGLLANVRVGKSSLVASYMQPLSQTTQSHRLRDLPITFPGFLSVASGVSGSTPIDSRSSRECSLASSETLGLWIAALWPPMAF
jgi:hypothetical protein